MTGLRSGKPGLTLRARISLKLIAIMCPEQYPAERQDGALLILSARAAPSRFNPWKVAPGPRPAGTATHAALFGGKIRKEKSREELSANTHSVRWKMAPGGCLIGASMCTSGVLVHVLQTACPSLSARRG